MKVIAIMIQDVNSFFSKNIEPVWYWNTRKIVKFHAPKKRNNIHVLTSSLKAIDDGYLQQYEAVLWELSQLLFQQLNNEPLWTHDHEKAL